MPLAVAHSAFHRICYNNKRNNVGGEREHFEQDQIGLKLMSVRSTSVSVRLDLNKRRQHSGK